MTASDLLFVLTGATAVDGGVAAVNLNILHALVPLAVERRRGLVVLSFQEAASDRPGFLPEWVTYRGFEGDKVALTAELLKVSSRRPIYLFDYVRLALPVLPLAKARWVNTVIFAHGWEYWKDLRRTDAWSLRAATLCLANSDFTLRKMKERLPGLQVKSCPLGLSPGFRLNSELPRPAENGLRMTAADGVERPLGPRALLLVGRMEPEERQKGHYALLEVLPELEAHHPDVQLVFAGPGRDRESVQRFALHKDVASRVFVPGRVAISTLEELYRNCYAFVMPSTQEGFGLAYLEAMNYGKACVGCSEQGAEDVILDGETGYLVRDPKDSRELCRVLRRLLSEPERSRRMGEKGFRRLHSNFTAAHFQKRFQRQIGALL